MPSYFDPQHALDANILAQIITCDELVPVWIVVGTPKVSLIFSFQSTNILADVDKRSKNS